MRIWSIHPRHLDRRALVAVWREGLLAQKVLRGETVGYRNHPQLIRFRTTADPPGAIAAYLTAIAREAEARGYHFDSAKLFRAWTGRIPLREGQLAYEWGHLRAKVRERDPAWMQRIQEITVPEAHPLFQLVPGATECWEVVPPG